MLIMLIQLMRIDPRDTELPMIALLVTAAWTAALLLVAALCASARVGDTAMGDAAKGAADEAQPRRAQAPWEPAAGLHAAVAESGEVSGIGAGVGYRRRTGVAA
jgi:hypothetical protein